MFFAFMDELRTAGIGVTLKEHLMLLEALESEVIERRPEEFYYLARATLVKDEGKLDRFDQVFSKVFKGLETNYGTTYHALKDIAKLQPKERREFSSLRVRCREV